MRNVRSSSFPNQFLSSICALFERFFLFDLNDVKHIFSLVHSTSLFPPPLFLNVLDEFCVLQNSQNMQILRRSSDPSSQGSDTSCTAKRESQVCHILQPASIHVRRIQITPNFEHFLGGVAPRASCSQPSDIRHRCVTLRRSLRYSFAPGLQNKRQRVTAFPVIEVVLPSPVQIIPGNQELTTFIPGCVQFLFPGVVKVHCTTASLYQHIQSSPPPCQIDQTITVLCMSCQQTIRRHFLYHHQMPVRIEHRFFNCIEKKTAKTPG